MGIDSEIIGAIIGPVLTALLAMIAYVVREWQSVRRWEGERDRALEQAINEVRYIDTYLSALNRVGDVDPDQELKRRRALVDLERSYQVMAVDLSDDGPRPRPRTVVEHVRHLLLLDLRKSFPKALRVLYHIFGLIGVLWTSVGISQFRVDSPDGLGVDIFASILLTVLGFVPMILIGWWARVADRDRDRPAVAQDGPGAGMPAGPFTDPGWRPPLAWGAPPPGPGRTGPGPGRGHGR